MYVCMFEKHMETLRFILYYINRTCGFVSNYFHRKFSNEAAFLMALMNSSTSHNVFCNALSKFITPAQRKTFNNDSVVIK